MDIQNAEIAAKFILDHDLIEEWTEGAIFPSEMAFFIASCTSEGVTTVIESGRENGYSALVLGKWAQSRGAKIISIDREEFPEVAERCHRRLNGYPVRMVKGEGIAEVGRAVMSNLGAPLALLLDGPKGFQALGIAAAAAPHVRLAGFHNFNKGAPDRKWFEEHGGTFYEQFSAGPEWDRLRDAELAFCHPENRTISHSTMGVVRFDRAHFPIVDNSYGITQPIAVRAAWKVGAYGATSNAVNFKDRVIGGLRRRGLLR